MVLKLPFDKAQNCPQKQLFTIDKTKYSVFYQYNHTSDIYTISIRRVADNVQLYLGKLVEEFYNNIKDDITKEVLFTLYVKDLKTMEIWII